MSEKVLTANEVWLDASSEASNQIGGDELRMLIDAVVDNDFGRVAAIDVDRQQGKAFFQKVAIDHFGEVKVFSAVVPIDQPMTPHYRPGGRSIFKHCPEIVFDYTGNI